MTYEEWLDSLPFYRTNRGIGRGSAVDLTICVYPNGFTSLVYKDTNTGQKMEQLLDKEKQSVDALREVWLRAQQHAQEPTERGQ